MDRILDAHPQFTEAVAGFAGRSDHEVVLLSGNHDGQLAWDGASVDVLTEPPRRVGGRLWPATS